jgi:hypothetical protein
VQIRNFLRGLQLEDLALAQACALGRDAAWHEFMARFRDSLTRAAVAMIGSEAAGEELADSLWPEIFGLSGRSAVGDMFWGDRCGTIVDPDRNRWMIDTHFVDSTPQEMLKKMKAMFAQNQAKPEARRALSAIS